MNFFLFFCLSHLNHDFRMEHKGNHWIGNCGDCEQCHLVIVKKKKQMLKFTPTKRRSNWIAMSLCADWNRWCAVSVPAPLILATKLLREKKLIFPNSISISLSIRWVLYNRNFGVFFLFNLFHSFFIAHIVCVRVSLSAYVALEINLFYLKSLGTASQ